MPSRDLSEEAILRAARRTLERHGWRALTGERLAAEAGISRVTLYRRGLTKEVILSRLASQAVERYRDAMWPVLTSQGAAGERLRRALEVLCELAEEHLSLLLALDAEANATIFHEDRQPEAMTRDVFTEPLERLLRDGAAEGSVRAVDDPAESATALFNMVGWTYVHLRTGHGWPAGRAGKATVDLVLNGLLAGLARAGASSGASG